MYTGGTWKVVITFGIALTVLYSFICCPTIQFPKVTTLGQPLEVIKTQMAANRSEKMVQALRTIYSRGGAAGFYQGLIPWAWIEASTKGAVLLFTAAEVEKAVASMGVSQGAGGLLGGISGGVAQAYATMGTFSRLHFAHRIPKTRSLNDRFHDLHEDG